MHSRTMVLVEVAKSYGIMLSSSSSSSFFGHDTHNDRGLKWHLKEGGSASSGWAQIAEFDYC